MNSLATYTISMQRGTGMRDYPPAKDFPEFREKFGHGV